MHHFFKHRPVVCGIYFQGTFPGLILGISATEEDFQQPGFLKDLKNKTDRIGLLTGTSTIRYAGILPSEMHRQKLSTSPQLKSRSAAISMVVFRAEKLLREELTLDKKTPVILLGGGGSVGTPLKHLLNAAGRRIYIVERNDSLPAAIHGKRAILIDVAHKGALEERVSELWSGIVILNETYPSPNRAMLQTLERLKIPVFHLAGVRGFALPAFPHAYNGGIPCCGMDDNGDRVPLIKHLTSPLLRDQVIELIAKENEESSFDSDYQSIAA